MKKQVLAWLVMSSLAGCAANNDAPLLFASAKGLGISIGANAAESGGEFVVGYKGQDFAVIPVSVVEAGGEKFVGAEPGGGFADSFSVLGQFDANAERQAKGANAGLGRFFATGNAAQRLALGFNSKMGGGNRTTVTECKMTTGGSGTLQPQPGPAPVSAAKAAAVSSASSTDRHGARMYFGQYDAFALALDGSAVDTGMKLTLGYRNRDVALIPVVGRDPQGNLVTLRSVSPGSGSDVLSVLGQFQSRNKGSIETTGSAISSSLESFFSTGGAARILSEGFQTRLCEQYVAPK